MGEKRLETDPPRTLDQLREPDEHGGIAALARKISRPVRRKPKK